jgi:hypothetical protein
MPSILGLPLCLESESCPSQDLHIGVGYIDCRHLSFVCDDVMVTMKMTVLPINIEDLECILHQVHK